MAVLVWRAYAFLAPGGAPYEPLRPLSTQLGQHFGNGSALGYFASKARDEGRPPSLDDVLSSHDLDHLEAYYFHRFYDFQPDLDTNNPALQEELRKLMGLWLELGVDGFRRVRPRPTASALIAR